MVNVSLFILFPEAEVEVWEQEFNVKTNRQEQVRHRLRGGCLLAERLIKKKELCWYSMAKRWYDADAKEMEKVEEVDIEREMGWKDGKIVLEDCPLKKHLISYLKKNTTWHSVLSMTNCKIVVSLAQLKIRGGMIIKNLSFLSV